MPIKLTLLDTISLQGNVRKPNEDAFGFHDQAAFVIDGATCLGDNIVTGEIGSDAAWLAEFCRLHFLEMLADQQPTRTIVELTNALVGQLFQFSARAHEAQDWQKPVASFLMARRGANGALQIEGLGDCVAFVGNSDGSTTRISPMADHGEFEMNLAREAILRSGGLDPEKHTAGDDTAKEVQRTLRAKYNTPGGPIWTLGCAPEAAHHVFSQSVAVEPGMPVLLSTDGFSALVDKYNRYTAASLLDAAQTKGLQSLMHELRHIEQNEDPQGHAHPRMKVSDDATAVLIRIDC